MDLDRDRRLSFNEWRQGAMTEPLILRCFMSENDYGSVDEIFLLHAPSIDLRSTAIPESKRRLSRARLGLECEIVSPSCKTRRRSKSSDVLIQVSGDPKNRDTSTTCSESSRQRWSKGTSKPDHVDKLNTVNTLPSKDLGKIHRSLSVPKQKDDGRITLLSPSSEFRHFSSRCEVSTTSMRATDNTESNLQQNPSSHQDQLARESAAVKMCESSMCYGCIIS